MTDIVFKVLHFIQYNTILNISVQVIYWLLILAICIRVIIDTRSVSKTLAYLLLVIFLPIIGAVVYLSIGVNYRKRKMYNKKLKIDAAFKAKLLPNRQNLKKYLAEYYQTTSDDYKPIVHLLQNRNLGNNFLLPNKTIKVLHNGEVKFPALIDALQQAKMYIHLEYYIYNDDVIGNQIKDILIEKALAGVAVRFIYDDFGSRKIRKSFVKELRDAGVEAYPFNKLIIARLANRLNYRNHRKIVIIDGVTSFVGGINVCDKYINTPNSDRLYWRDTHLMIEGLSTFLLQQIFLSDWNFASGQHLEINEHFFPILEPGVDDYNHAVQIVASGPDSDLPNILLAIIQSIYTAKEEILLTTPYYIPDVNLQQALVLAAMSGKKVKLLVPARGDSFFVSMASKAFYDELLIAGVEIYEYTKGFVHAKTFIIDRKVASVGTANLDARSFDLNFEVTTLIYDEAIAQNMAAQFDIDIADATVVHYKVWKRRNVWTKFFEKIVRLLSPLL